MARPHHIGIVEDHEPTRSLLVGRLAQRPDVTVAFAVGSVEAMQSWVEQVDRASTPDAILMDIGLPGLNGIEGARWVTTALPNVEVLMLTVFDDPDSVFQAVRAGASGYLLKDSPLDEILDAVGVLRDGGAAMSPAIARKAVEFIRGQDSRKEQYGLSERESQILAQLVDGFSHCDIAETLFISPHTVRTHIKNVYRKLQVDSRASAVRVALRERLVD